MFLFRFRECLKKICERNLVLNMEVNHYLFDNNKLCLDRLAEQLIIAYIKRVVSIKEINGDILKEIQRYLMSCLVIKYCKSILTFTKVYLDNLIHLTRQQIYFMNWNQQIKNYQLYS